MSKTCLSANYDEGSMPYHLSSNEFFRLFVWCITLLLGYGLGRCLCSVKGKFGECSHQNKSRLFENFSALLAMGIILALFTGVLSENRFNYIYGFKAETRYSGVIFLFAFVLAPFIWKYLNTVEMTQTFTLTGDGVRDNIGPFLILITTFIFLIIWHLTAAYKVRVFKIYLASRGLVYIFFTMNILVCISDSDLKIHMHHYQMAWLFALLGSFNHPVSLLTLAFATGVFVEGLSAYGADPLFLPDN